MPLTIYELQIAVQNVKYQVHTGSSYNGNGNLLPAIPSGVRVGHPVFLIKCGL